MALAAGLAKVGQDKMPDIHKAAFLGDEASQILALSDALSSAHGSAISAAFDDVARTRGLAQLAEESSIRLEDLYRALSDPARPDCAVLHDVVEALMRRLPHLRDFK